MPHTEVNAIGVDGEPVGLAFVVNRACTVDIYPVSEQFPPFAKEHLQIAFCERFISDGHLGTLSRNLRLLGFDTHYDRFAKDRDLIAAITPQDRALLTRDRRLLMHKTVRTGYCPRSTDGVEQTIEVCRRFHLAERIAPFTRCLHCNHPLALVDKDDVVDRLEPLTKKYYDAFRRCPGCGRIYWRGSHFDKLRRRVDEIRAQLGQESL